MFKKVISSIKNAPAAVKNSANNVIESAKKAMKNYINSIRVWLQTRAMQFKAMFKKAVKAPTNLMNKIDDKLAAKIDYISEKIGTALGKIKMEVTTVMWHIADTFDTCLAGEYGYATPVLTTIGGVASTIAIIVARLFSINSFVAVFGIGGSVSAISMIVCYIFMGKIKEWLKKAVSAVKKFVVKHNDFFKNADKGGFVVTNFSGQKKVNGVYTYITVNGHMYKMVK